MKIGDKIYHYKITINFIENVVTKEKDESQVLGINEKMLVLNDYYFTNVDLKKESSNWNGIINKPSASHTKFSNWRDQIDASMYSTESNEKKAYTKIKKELEKFIYEKFGRYASATDILNTLEI